MKKSLKFALVVTSRNREVLFKRFLDSIRAQTYLNFAVVACIQDSEYVSLDSKMQDVSFHLIKSEKLSLSSARNLCLEYIVKMELEPDIIAFPDDDCWYPPDLLSKINSFMVNYPWCSVLCTRVFDPIRNMPYGRRPANRLLSVTGMRLFTLPVSVGIFINTLELPIKTIIFNERLGAGTAIGSGEETELLYRLARHNSTIIYNGFLRVYHELDDISSVPVAKSYEYAFGFGLLVRMIFLKGGILELFMLISFVISTILHLVFSQSSQSRSYYFARMCGLVHGFFSLRNSI